MGVQSRQVPHKGGGGESDLRANRHHTRAGSLSSSTKTILNVELGPDTASG